MAKRNVNEVKSFTLEGKQYSVVNQPGKGPGRPMKLVKTPAGRYIPYKEFLAKHPDLRGTVCSTYKPRKEKGVKATAKKSVKKVAKKTVKAKSVKKAAPAPVAPAAVAPTAPAAAPAPVAAPATATATTAPAA